MRKQTLLVAALAFSITQAVHAKELRCGEVFVRSSAEMQALMNELAELHLLANGQGSVAVTAFSNDKFSSRFAEVSEHFGQDQTREALKQAIKRVNSRRATEISEDQNRRKNEVKTLGRTKVTAKFIERIPGYSANAFTDGLGLPDGSKLIKSLNGDKLQRLILSDEGPYYKFETMKFPDWKQQDPMLPTRWDIRATDAGWIGIGKETTHMHTDDIWFWKVAKGAKAIESLPRPDPKDHRTVGSKSDVQLGALSPNGKFAISTDDSGVIHRLALGNGKKSAAIEQIADLAGAWVRDDGSIIAWSRKGRQWEFDKDLKAKALKTFSQLYPQNGSGLVQVSASPKREQIIFMTDEGAALLVDLKKGKSKRYPLGDFAEHEVVWRENTVWVESTHVMHPIPRDLGKAPDFAVPKEVIRDNYGKRFHARIQRHTDSESSLDYLTVTDIDNGKETSLPWEKLKREWGGGYSVGWERNKPVVLNDGTLLAVHTWGGRYGDVVFLDLIRKEIVGALKLTNSYEQISEIPYFSANDQTLVLDIYNKSNHEYEVQIWRIEDEASGSEP